MRSPTETQAYPPAVALPRAIEARGLKLIGHSDLDGHGDGMQIARSGEIAYVGHMGDSGVGTSVVDVSDPRRPRVLRQLPAPAPARSHKVQCADGLLLVNHELFPPRDVPAETGLAVYDLSRPAEPKRLGSLSLEGLGVHRMWWTGGRYTAHKPLTRYCCLFSGIERQRSCLNCRRPRKGLSRWGGNL